MTGVFSLSFFSNYYSFALFLNISPMSLRYRDLGLRLHRGAGPTYRC